MVLFSGSSTSQGAGETSGVIILRRYLNVRLTIISIGAAAIPVSCTHLDVYKRQGIYRYIIDMYLYGFYHPL